MQLPFPMPRRSAGMMAALRILAAAVMLFFAAAIPARAVDIERVVSPGGIEAWLVSESTVPMINVNFAFLGGAAQDPEDKPGVANLMSALLDEGAGELDSQAFQLRLAELAVDISFDATRDAFYGQMRTLTETREEAFDLLRLAVNEPRFDAEAVERMRSQIEAGLRRELQDPNNVAGRTWSEAVFGAGHPYGRPVNGTLETLPQIVIEDLQSYHRRNLARDNLYIAVVGDVDAQTLAPLLDEVFGGLPAAAELMPVLDVDLTPAGYETVVEMAIPQTVIQLGREGLRRDDPDFIAAYVANHILGGGSFSSRLYKQVREERGLAYSVYTYLYPLDSAGMFIGGVATRNDAAAESLSLIQNAVRQMAEDGPTQDELDTAKRYLKGSYALRFDTSGKIARQLVQIQIDELGIDYINIRNDLIDALTLEDVRRAASRLLGNGELKVVLVGQPEGLSGTGDDG